MAPANVVLARQQQELFEFGTKEIGAARVVKGQRGERFKHAETAHVAPVFGFDANDGDDDFFRHTISGAGTGEADLVFLPELHAPVDPPLVQETWPVPFPRALHRRNGGLDQFQHLGVRADLGELLQQLVGVEAFALFKVADKFDHLRVAGKAGHRCCCLAKAGRGCKQQGRKGVFQIVLHQGSRAMAARNFVKSSGKRL